jgi:hypothetical protein
MLTAQHTHVPVTRMVSVALAPGRSAHDRQRELVRASLLACPGRAPAARRSA